VIKIEPSDAVTRPELYVGARESADMQNLHRNKRSLTLDFKNPAGREVLLRLVRKADVLVENFRPDVKNRLGLDYETLREINPRLVLVSISGFGQDGPYRDKPGFDQILQGMCGLQGTTGEAEGPPMRTGASVIDVAAGLYAAIGAMTALLEREKSGKGQWVQTSLLHSGIGLMDYLAARYVWDGKVPVRFGNDHPASMPTSVYQTSDGYMNIGASGEKMWRALCVALEVPDLLEDPDFETDPLRVQNRRKLNAHLNERFLTRSTAQWIERLGQADVPCGPIYTMDQVFADPQTLQQEIAEPVDDPRYGQRSLISQVVRMDRTPGRIGSLLEDKGASTDAILADLGYAPEEIARLRELGAV
jgi:crotonobetainyl-CoA:carnitine CoA-transferase CaiB-like acyl-CoA transferase